MDTLVSIGSTAAFVLSVVATFFPGVVGMITFYDTAALIITLIFLGKYLEARAKGQTHEAIKKLMGLQAHTAQVIRNGQEVDVPLAEVIFSPITCSWPAAAPRSRRFSAFGSPCRRRCFIRASFSPASCSLATSPR